MSPQDAGNRNASAPDVREAFLAWIRDDGYLVPSAVTDIEWDDEGLPVYYTRDDGVRHYLDGEWHAWQAATARAERAEAERDSARAELAEQRKLWEQIPGGPDYDADENDLSPDDAASHLAGIAIRRIDAETRGAGE